jgi:mannose-1-phosphate guanylyltransferase/mannose-6-phosphate isomerase
MADNKPVVFPVLLAGGVGSRLWPVSRKLFPKQLVKFIGNDSLVQSTVKRLLPTLDGENIRIVCGREHYHEIARHLEEIGISAREKIISEPCGRNTGPAILLAVMQILAQVDDAVVCIFPADHVVKDIDSFHERLNAAISLAHNGHVVTFGIEPGYPETGYGYIEGAERLKGGALVTKRFVEKPDKETAERYLRAGNFFWNSGMFAFKASVILEEFNLYQADLLEQMRKIDPAAGEVEEGAYRQLPDISIDYAIMENTRKGVVLPSDFGWSDIGTWKSLYEFLPKDSRENVIDGDVITKDTRNCLIMGHERLIATNHLHNTVVVETPDSIFVSDIDNSRDVKSIVDSLKADGREEYQHHRTRYFPWGKLALLEKGRGYKVDRLEIYPGAVFSVDRESNGTYIFTVARGGVKIVTDSDSCRLERGESLNISARNIETVENTGTESLVIICVEVWIDP